MEEKKVDQLLKVVALQDPQILLDNISERINALQEINNSYPRYTGTIYSASKEVEDDIEKLLDELDDAINVVEDPEVWALFDSESQAAMNEWIQMTRVGIQANRVEVKKARAFLATYGQ